jgi:hypothetical protein
LPFAFVIFCLALVPAIAFSSEPPLVVSKINKEKVQISERHRLASLPIWRDNKSEWLSYAVQAPSRGFTLEGNATLVLKPLPNGSKIESFELETSRFVQGDVGVIYHQSDLRWSLTTEQLESGRFIRGHLPGGVFAKRVVKQAEGYQWTETLGANESEAKSGQLKGSVLFEESVFLELRNWPLDKGFVREIGWFPIVTTENPPLEAVYARVEVVGAAQMVRDISVWHVRIKPASGRSSEVFVQCGGTHPVIEAKLSDGSTWSLQTSTRR